VTPRLSPIVSLGHASIDPLSILPLKLRTRPRTGPSSHDLIRNIPFRRWFSQYRKAILRDELYAPSCQRLTRPTPYTPVYMPYIRTAFHPVGAPSCFSQTVSDTSSDPWAWKRKLDLLRPYAEHRRARFSFIWPASGNLPLDLPSCPSISKVLQSIPSFFRCFEIISFNYSFPVKNFLS